MPQPYLRRSQPSHSSLYIFYKLPRVIPRSGSGMTEADHLSPGVYEPRKKAHSELRQRATSTHRSSDADSRDACDASSIIDPAPSLQQSLRDDDRSLSIISTGPQCANEKISDSHESSPWSRKIILALGMCFSSSLAEGCLLMHFF